MKSYTDEIGEFSYGHINSPCYFRPNKRNIGKVKKKRVENTIDNHVYSLYLWNAWIGSHIV